MTENKNKTEETKEVSRVEKEQEFNKKLAKNLLLFRRSRNLTQGQLATKLGYSDKSISKWERGEGAPDAFTLTQIALFFNTSVDNLISEIPKLDKKINRIYFALMNFVIFLAIGFLVFIFLAEIPGWEYSWLAILYSIPPAVLSAFIAGGFYAVRWKFIASAAAFYFSISVALHASFTTLMIVNHLWVFWVAALFATIITVFATAIRRTIKKLPMIIANIHQQGEEKE
ncbi:MAG: helix-turn-helix domain-containing protein [Firmicutes bacterium]|nr:helix-turn-helix domain-containing protein [Bacillota bacterium]